MADFLNKEQRSINMSKIKSSGTKPELILFDLVNKIFQGIEIISHPKDVPGKPDIWIPSLNLAIFADGCFFHNCPKHGHIPLTNQDYWKAKLKRNQERDRRINKELKQLGLKVIRIWEHQLTGDLSEAKRKIRHVLKAINKLDL